MKGHQSGNPSTVIPGDHKLAVLGHELGNVLNGLLGMAELLGHSRLTVEQGRWLKAIEYSCRQMEFLIRSDGCFNAGGQQSMTVHRERMDGVEMLEQLVISHTRAAQSRQNQLLLIVPAEMSRYWLLDVRLVRQLLDNLVGNAIKFTVSGEIIIEASPVSADGNDDGAIRFRISDTGPGIDDVEAGHIFSAYRRCTDSADQAIGNLGLGLYICRNIVNAMEGRITCTSPAGSGACFEVLLPGALSTGKSRPSMLRCMLLDQIRCQLQLEGSLRRCISKFLARLGVKYSERPAASTGHGLDLIIGVAPDLCADDPPSLLFTPATGSGPTPEHRYLEAPFLESSLGALLLEIAFEWRRLVLRNENRGSAPRLL